MSYESILKDVAQKKFKPVYLLEGQEDYFIDQVSNLLEHEVLTDAEKEFNLTIFYGKDAEWSDIVNACRRYPMFSDRQVVMVKEAQAMLNLNELESYLQNPLSSTLLVLVHKQGKVDGRTGLSRLIKKNGEVLTTEKLYENQLPSWVNNYVKNKGLTIAPKAVSLLVESIGNDLSRLANELNKVIINLKPKQTINEDIIEQYVGISKEYNPFELQKALGQKDLAKAISIIHYFEANPKAGSIMAIIPVVYSFFSKLYLVVTQPSASKETLASMGVPPRYHAEYMQAARLYKLQGVERAILLLNQYNLRGIGVNDAGTPNGALLRELAVKLMLA